jgi:AcrR family transcriptional regulator
MLRSHKMPRRVADVPTAPPRLAGNQADPRVKRTRKLLQDALVELMAEKSFDAITVQDIADRSTINRATFYAHFVDKYDLFAAYSRGWFRQALHDGVPGCGFSRANLELLILASMRALAELDDHCHPNETLKPLVMSAVQEELSAFLRDWLNRLAPAEARDTSALETTADGLSWAIFGTALDWSRMATRSPAEPAAAQIASLLTEGLPSVLEFCTGL